jgi:hypothetical protein
MFLRHEKVSYAITNSGQGSFNLNYRISRIAEDHRVLYSFSESDLMTESQVLKLSPSGIKEKESNIREVTLPELKQILINANMK